MGHEFGIRLQANSQALIPDPLADIGVLVYPQGLRSYSLCQWIWDQMLIAVDINHYSTGRDSARMGL